VYRTGAYGVGSSVGVPPYVKDFDQILGTDWLQRAAVCFRLRFTLDLNTSNEWHQSVSLPGSVTGSLHDVGWSDQTSVDASLDGYSATLGEPVSSLITSWQRGIPLRWKGTSAMRIDALRGLPGADGSPCSDYTASQHQYRGAEGDTTVEIVPDLETYDPQTQTVDSSLRLQVRFGEAGGAAQWVVRSIPGCTGDHLIHAYVPIFSWSSRARGDEGLFNQVRGMPLTIGTEIWYTLPFKNTVSNSYQLNMAGPIGDFNVKNDPKVNDTGPCPSGPSGPLPCNWNPQGSAFPGSWNVDGTFTVRVIPPS
jgi:hypothetical protein